MLTQRSELIASLLWRVIASAWAAFCYVLIRRLPAAWLMRYTYAFLTGIGVITCTIMSVGLGLESGIPHPYSSGRYMVPIIAVAFLAPLRIRVVATALLGASCLLGVLVLQLRGAIVEDVGSALGLLTIAVVVSIGMGHVIHGLACQNFLQGQRLEALNKNLEGLVEERTRDLRVLTARLVEGAEHERIRIARELHDEFGQLLTALRLDLEQPAPGTGARHARDILDMATSSLDAVIADLRPPALSEGLGNAISHLAAHHERRTGTDCSWRVAVDETRLSHQCLVGVFRVTQEALTNVARHARARSVQIDVLEQMDDGGSPSLILTITDDGQGFRWSGTEDRRYGLLGMQERARILGGRLEILAQPERGTRILMQVPLESAPG
jgi:signal transduction histidine kinase